ncbi:MAG: LysR family transcriptional regulator [Ascidiaceihabitans sp.]|uniref:LysR family transcriptional regulator n=1 Tax=Ascidiaceihabitans sp. TaxID=1872644 RepID=UPI0032986DD4
MYKDTTKRQSSMVAKQIAKADIHLLRVFCVVAEAEGFSNAQVVLNVATSTISRQISELETRLGMRLCDRGRTGFRLTDNGTTVYQAAQKLFGALGEFQETVDGSRGRLFGHLSLGIIENWASNKSAPIVRALSEFMSKAPDVTIEMHSLAPNDIEFAVLDDKVSIGIGVFHSPKPGLIYTDVCKEMVRLYCGADHPLFDLDDPAKVEAALHRSLFAKRAYLNEDVVAPKTRDFPSNATAHQMEANALLILTGKYVGYLPSYFAEEWVADGRMKNIANGGYDRVVTVQTAIRRGVRPNNVSKTFLEIFASETKAFSTV